MFKGILVYFFILVFPEVCLAQNIPLFEKLSFLDGKWSLKTDKGRIVESWKWINNSQLEGFSYSISHSGDSTLLETIQLNELNGDILFIPTGFGEGNNTKVAFKLISAENNTFVFENKEHDFPSRIVYQSLSKDKILAWIEGSIGGQFKKIEYPYTREIL
jgi:hypothetical protein